MGNLSSELRDCRPCQGGGEQSRAEHLMDQAADALDAMEAALRELVSKWDRFQDRGAALTRRDFKEARELLARIAAKAETR